MSEGRKSQGLQLACFGKHPGWNDHIDDIGIRTPDLAEAKRLLYIEGVAGNIDSGAWEAIPEASRLPGFGHEFIWRWRGSILFGRMWSSVDGKGRSRYPMILCGSIDEDRLQWVIDTGLPKLAELEDTCRIKETASEIIAAVESTRSALDASYSSATPVTASSSAIRDVRSHPDLTSKEDGFERVMYQIERDMGQFARPMADKTKGSPTRLEAVRAQHARMPRCSSNSTQGLALWSRFAAERFFPGAPLLLIANEGEPFVDIIAGEPGEAQFLCLRAGAGAIPCACDVPYTLSDEDRARIRSDAEAAKPSPFLAEERSITGGIGKTVGKITKNPGAKERSTKPTGSKSKMSPLVLGGILLGAAILLGVLVMVLGGKGGAEKPEPAGKTPIGGAGASQQQRPQTGSPERPQRPDPQPVVETPNVAPPANIGAADRPVPPSGPLAGEELARWRRVCDAYQGWFFTLHRVADRDAMRRDTHLASAVVPLIEDVDAVNPQKIAGTSAPIQQLRDEPPASAGDGMARLRTEDAEMVLDGLRAALAPENWPARGTITKAAEHLRAIGMAKSASIIEAPSRAVNFEDGRSLSVAITGVLDAWRQAGAVGTAAHDIATLLNALDASEDPLLSRARAMVAGWDAAVPSDADASRISEVLQQREEIRAVARIVENRDIWSKIDHPRLRRSSVYASSSGSITVQTLREWREIALSDAVRIVEASDDPRTGWSPDGKIEELRSALGLISAEAAVSSEESERLGGELDDLVSAIKMIRAEAITRADLAGINERIGRVGDRLTQSERTISDAVATLTGQHEAFLAQLRSQTRGGGVASPALDRAHARAIRSMIERMPTVDRFLELQREKQAFDEAISMAQGTWPGAYTAPVDAGWLDAEALRSHVEARREAFYAQIAEGPFWNGPFAGVEPPVEAWASRVASEASWRSGADGVITEIDAALEAIDAGRSIGAELTIEQARAKVASWRQWVGYGEIEPVIRRGVARFDRVIEVATLVDPDDLLAVMASDDAPVALIAARAVMGLDGWPSSTGELAVVLANFGDFGSGLRAQMPEAVVSETTNAKSAFVKSAWTRLAGESKTVAQLDAALAMREAAGGRIEDLSPRIRFELVMREGQTQLAQAIAHGDDDAMRAQLASLVERLNSTGHTPGAAQESWLDKASRLAAGDDSAVAVADFSQAGPAKKDWTYEVLDDGERVRFTSPEGDVSIHFLRVPGEVTASSTAAAYVSAGEVTVAQFVRMMQGIDPVALSRDWKELLAARGTRRTQWRGPRSWAWDPDQNRIRASEQWLGERTISERYAPGSQPPPPSPRSPMQSVSVKAAVLATAQIGCRLPKLSEWQAFAADSLARASEEPGAFQLRDASWSMQQAHQLGLLQQGVTTSPDWPDDGIFVPFEIDVARGRSATARTQEHDGVLWFADVDDSAPRGEHWVGNVAEFVVDGVNAFVVGGSSLSPPEMGLADPLAVAGWGLDLGASDVGFRVAFTLEGAGVGIGLPARVRRLMLDAPVLGAD